MKRGLMMTTLATAGLFLVGSATAATVPYTEEFGSDAANWLNASFGPLDWNAAGGPDGGSHVSTTFNFFNFSAPFSPAQFRGEDDFGASGGNFEGNWISEGIDTFSVWVRHDAPFGLNWFARFADPSNFPGAVAVKFTPVAPHTWTEISVPIAPTNPEFVTFEGSDFNTVFSDIGHLHIGVDVSDSLKNLDQDVVLDIDKPTITPEPAGVLSLLAGLCFVLSPCRRRKSGHDRA